MKVSNTNAENVIIKQQQSLPLNYMREQSIEVSNIHAKIAAIKLAIRAILLVIGDPYI